MALGVSCATSLLVTPFVRRLALRYDFRDRPSPKRIELKPRLGGLAIYLGYGVAVASSAPLVVGRTVMETNKILGLLLGSTVVVAMGAVDDRQELAALPQLLAQVAAALVATAFGIVIDRVTNPFGTALVHSMFEVPAPLAFAFTIFWIVGAINTINFIDGLDGLAAGITAIAAAVLFLHCLQMGQYSVAVLPLALAGAALGFLPYNFSPARITMGTSGAAFLGFALGTLSILGGTKAATVLLVLGVPILDTAWIIVGRLMRGQSPFRGDRTHLHHRLMELGLSPSQIVLIFYGLCGGFGTLALVLSSRRQKLYALGGMVVLLGGALALIAQRSFAKEE